MEERVGEDWLYDYKAEEMKISIKNPNTGSEINNVTIKEFIHILHNPLEDEGIGAQFLYDYDDLKFTSELEQQNKELIEVLKESNDYLKSNNLNYIGSGSILHIKMKKVLKTKRNES